MEVHEITNLNALHNTEGHERLTLRYLQTLRVYRVMIKRSYTNAMMKHDEDFFVMLKF